MLFGHSPTFAILRATPSSTSISPVGACTDWRRVGQRRLRWEFQLRWCFTYIGNVELFELSMKNLQRWA